ncbi:carbohydrate-binding protein [Sphaerimonospora cavernae]|uniref:Carbohydrate-binding protein n=1 Tax=Sphaerimonospora cavernae TaxID=1740611 RepID=A0ABV6U852_9ACTN
MIAASLTATSAVSAAPTARAGAVQAQALDRYSNAMADDFSVSLNPDSAAVTVRTGEVVLARVNTVVTDGSAQPINLSVHTPPLPDSGLAFSFNSPTIMAGQYSTLAIAPSSQIPKGTYQITVVATGASVTREATFFLTIDGHKPPPMPTIFTSVEPSSVTVQAGQSTTVTLNTEIVSSGPVPLTLSAIAPYGATVTFNPSTVMAGEASTVTITTAEDLVAGSHEITLLASVEWQMTRTRLSLTVTKASSWATWTPYKVGDTVTYVGQRYRCIQAHTSLPGWEPPIVPALWQRI